MYATGILISYMAATTPSQSAESAFWPWLGFIMPMMAGQVFAIDAGHALFALIVSGIILAVWQ